MNVQLLCPETPLIQKTIEILTREITKRTGLPSLQGVPAPDLILDLAPGLGTEGFRIEDGPEGAVRVVGNDERGLLYGVGRFLRDARYAEGELTPGDWRGTSVPEKPVRAMYFATHFHNFYHDAPLAEVERYVEELALWGCNALSVWFDMHHYAGIDDPAAQAMIERLRAILKAANAVGMGAGLTTLGNEAYGSSPEELRAVPTNCGHYHVELCPSRPEALQLMLKWREEMIAAFADLDVEYVWLWPYDQGGCRCADCAPWGANGFLKIAEPVARLVRGAWPRAKIVLSTWCFDYEPPGGDYAGLSAAFAERPDWVDYLMVDSHTVFPPYVLEHGAPGGLPVLNFPEISMHGMGPWGGFGANPLPARFQELWGQCSSFAAGGFPYSEGIFEDLNKVMYLQFYWQADREALDIVREYAAYEFAPQVADRVVRAVQAMEAAHWFRPDFAAASAWAKSPEPPEPLRLLDPATLPGPRTRPALLQEAEAELSPRARRSWRWRILRLREALDLEFRRSGGVLTDAADECLCELGEIYHAGQAEAAVAPPSRKALRRLFGSR